LKPAKQSARLRIVGELLLRQWAEEVLLYHCPSATTSVVSPPLGAALAHLRRAPATVAELNRRIAGNFPGENDLGEHLHHGLERLRREGILMADDGADARRA